MTGQQPAGTDLSGRTVGDFLDRLAARVPAPGGGATAALHVAQAAALLAMVARYTTGPKHAAAADLVAEVTAAADAERAAGVRLADADAAAFTAVTEAYRLPAGTPDEQAARSSAIAAALTAAAGPPAEVVRAADRLLTLAERLLPVANRNVVTDVAAATEAARAAATTGRLNIEINLGGIRDPAARAGLAEALALVDDVVRRAAEVERSVRDLLG